MIKESLYCIPHNQRINRKDGFVYHCEREIDADPAEKNRCQVCKKEFQDERCVKIHKTKMNHWDLPSASSSNNSPVAKTNKKKPAKKKKEPQQIRKPAVQKQADATNSHNKRHRSSSGTDNNSRSNKFTKIIISAVRQAQQEHRNVQPMLQYI